MFATSGGCLGLGAYVGSGAYVDFGTSVGFRNFAEDRP